MALVDGARRQNVSLLTVGRMETEKLRESSQFRILNLLSAINSGNPKDLAIHEDLMKPLDQVVGAKKLRDHGVEKMFKLGSSSPQWKNSTRIYLVPATCAVAENVSRQLRAGETTGTQYHVLMVPKVLAVIQSLFESFGVLDLATFHNMSWDLIPLDRNLLSLELAHFFRSAFVRADRSLLGPVAKSLMSLECLYGKIKMVTTLGRLSHTVHNLLEVWHREVCPTLPAESAFSHLILMDRDVDFASVLLTQLNYEGVLDENFGVSSGFVTLASEQDVQRIMLNTGKDEIYAEIRGRHFSSVLALLSEKAKQLQALRDKKNTASLEEMKQFVAHDLKQIQSQQKLLALHITACELVMKKQTGLLEELLTQQHNVTSGTDLKELLHFMEDSMARSYDRTSILRLLCLYSLFHEGLSDHKTWIKQFLQSYGYRDLATLHRLQCLQILTVKDTSADVINLPDKLARAIQLAPQLIQPTSKRPSFRSITQRLNLTGTPSNPVAQEAIKSGQHPSYVFGGTYTPLVYRLVEKCLAREKDPGALDDLARCFGNDLRSSTSSPSSAGSVLVLIVGGVTLAEAASLDLLSRLSGRTIVVAGTNIINGIALIGDVSSSA